MKISASRSILHREVTIFLSGHVTLAEMNLGIIKALAQQNDTLFKQNFDLAGGRAHLGPILGKAG